jgi:putative FmdB family regulatory protein
MDPRRAERIEDMPTYDYRCEACGHAFEQFQNITEKKRRKCPDCGKSALVRLFGAGVGVIFRGSGFYETDYKRARTPESKSEPVAGGGGAEAPKDAPAKTGKPATAAKKAKAPEASA